MFRFQLKHRLFYRSFSSVSGTNSLVFNVNAAHNITHIPKCPPLKSDRLSSLFSPLQTLVDACYSLPDISAQKQDSLKLWSDALTYFGNLTLKSGSANQMCHIVREYSRLTLSPHGYIIDLKLLSKLIKKLAENFSELPLSKQIDLLRITSPLNYTTGIAQPIRDSIVSSWSPNSQLMENVKDLSPSDRLFLMSLLLNHPINAPAPFLLYPHLTTFEVNPSELVKEHPNSTLPLMLLGLLNKSALPIEFVRDHKLLKECMELNHADSLEAALAIRKLMDQFHSSERVSHTSYRNALQLNTNILKTIASHSKMFKVPPATKNNLSNAAILTPKNILGFSTAATLASSMCFSTDSSDANPLRLTRILQHALPSIHEATCHVDLNKAKFETDKNHPTILGLQLLANVTTTLQTAPMSLAAACRKSLDLKAHSPISSAMLEALDNEDSLYQELDSSNTLPPDSKNDSAFSIDMLIIRSFIDSASNLLAHSKVNNHIKIPPAISNQVYSIMADPSTPKMAISAFSRRFAEDFTNLVESDSFMAGASAAEHVLLLLRDANSKMVTCDQVANALHACLAELNSAPVSSVITSEYVALASVLDVACKYLPASAPHRYSDLVVEAAMTIISAPEENTQPKHLTIAMTALTRHLASFISHQNIRPASIEALRIGIRKVLTAFSPPATNKSGNDSASDIENRNKMMTATAIASFETGIRLAEIIIRLSLSPSPVLRDLVSVPILSGDADGVRTLSEFAERYTNRTWLTLQERWRIQHVGSPLGQSLEREVNRALIGNSEGAECADVGNVFVNCLSRRGDVAVIAVKSDETGLLRVDPRIVNLSDDDVSERKNIEGDDSSSVVKKSGALIPMKEKLISNIEDLSDGAVIRADGSVRLVQGQAKIRGQLLKAIGIPRVVFISWDRMKVVGVSKAVAESMDLTLKLNSAVERLPVEEIQW